MIAFLYALGFVAGVLIVACWILTVMTNAQTKAYSASLGPDRLMEDGTWHDPRCVWPTHKDGTPKKVLLEVPYDSR